MILTPEWPAPEGVFAAVSTRLGGCSQPPFDAMNTATHVGDNPDDVAKNRALLLEHLALPAEPLWLDQVHSTAVVDAAVAAPNVSADASHTRAPNVICAVQTADCLPVLFCSREGDRVAAAHAGWAGLKAGILEQTVKALGAVDGLSAWLGPAISQRHFEVGPEVYAGFLDAADAATRQATAAAFVASARSGHWYADLYQLARIRLQSLGVGVFGGGYCTYAESQRFYSYRRDGQTGRMTSLIYIKG